MAQTAAVAAHSLPSFAPSQNQRRHASKHRLFCLELSQALFDFVVQLLPTAEELAVKEDVRKLLERLIHTIQPESRLLSFGSTANGFSLRNSDMDLCCLIDSDERLPASDLVVTLGDLLQRETKFHVKPLPHARIPIVKLSLDPSPGLPSGIACDIGFENRLALENTRLLMCYAMIDPTRIRTLVLFLKVWSKRRKINSPYYGTLSSYGYVLLVIYFLIHVKNPPVLPNLQQIPPLRPISKADTHINGHNTWFFDDIDLLCQRWRSSNTETVAELLIEFFRYYSRDFSYNTGVASIRAGLLKKDSKGWQNDLSNSKYNDSRERNRFCIEDPFEVDYNVARCVTKEGLYQIRGEFMRASRILAMRPRALAALTQLCEEKIGEPQTVPASFIFVPPRLSVPLQATHSVGTSPTRSKGSSPSGRLSLRPEFFDHSKEALMERCTSVQPPPEHMAPKRSQWTSPPPPEAPPAQHAIFEDQLDQGLVLATSSSDAREHGISIRSNDSPQTASDEERRSEVTQSDDVDPDNGNSDALDVHRPLLASPIPLGLEPRGRLPACPVIITDDHTVQSPSKQDVNELKVEPLRRSHSGPSNLKTNRFSWPSTSTTIYPAPSASAQHTHIAHIHSHPIPGFDSSNVFYETAANNSCFPHIAHLQPRQHSVGAYPPASSHHHRLPSAPRYSDRRQGDLRGLEGLSQQTPRRSHEPQEIGANILEHKLSAIQLSGAGSSDVSTEHSQTGDGSPERSLSQNAPSQPRYQTLPTATLTYSPTCDAVTTSLDSRPLPVAQMAQRRANSRSTSHSPLRASIHHRNTTAASLATTPESPSFSHTPSGPISHGSDVSTPSSMSLPPSPSPTILPSHSPQLHEESPRSQTVQEGIPRDSS
ncbi:hypothetical protein J3A83DRAFT_4215925 [Scleroderma citrinum]